MFQIQQAVSFQQAEDKMHVLAHSPPEPRQYLQNKNLQFGKQITGPKRKKSMPQSASV